MTHHRSRLTSQGQISVPAEVRRELGLGPGSVLLWQKDGDHVVVTRVGRFSSSDVHAAAFGRRTPAARTLTELRKGIVLHARRRARR